MSWFGILVPLAFVTQLFAGSSYSPGQGGGFRELIWWVVLFGAIVVALVVERHVHTLSDALVDLARVGAAGGFVVGGVVALVWFTTKGGPQPGDWFVGPAGACVGAAIALYGGTRRR